MHREEEQEEKEEIILPEKKLYVLDPLGYYSVTSTVVDESKREEHGVTQSPDGDFFIVKKTNVEDFDVFIGVKEYYDAVIKVDGVVTQLPPNFERIKSHYDEWLPPLVSVKDKMNIEVFMKKECFDLLDVDSKKKYDQTPIIFYKSKKPLNFGPGIVTCYVIFDGNEISAIPITSGSSQITAIPLSSFTPGNQLILVNYKKEVEYYVSSTNYGRLDSKEQAEYDYSIGIVFYKKKTSDELRKIAEIALTSSVSNENKMNEEYEKLLKELQDPTQPLFYFDYHYPIGSYREDPEYKALTKLSKENNLLFLPTNKKEGLIYFKLSKHESDEHEYDEHESDEHESDAHESDEHESDEHESDEETPSLNASKPNKTNDKIKDYIKSFLFTDNNERLFKTDKNRSKFIKKLKQIYDDKKVEECIEKHKVKFGKNKFKLILKSDCKNEIKENKNSVLQKIDGINFSKGGASQKNKPEPKNSTRKVY